MELDLVPRFRHRAVPAMWFAWLAFALWLTVGPFRWHVEYFRSPGPQFYRMILVLLPLLALTAAVYPWWRRRGAWRLEPLAFAAVPLIGCVACEPRAAAVTLLTLCACYVTGRACLDRLGLETELLTESLGLSLALGVGLLSSALFVLGMLDAFYPAVFLILLLTPCLVFRARVMRLIAELRGIVSVWRSDTTLNGPFLGVLIPFGLLFTLFTTMLMLAPSINTDTMTFHLPEIRHFVAERGVTPLPDLPYAYFPKGSEVLAALGYALGGQPAAQMLGPLFFLATLLLIYALARRCGFERLPSVVGALLAGTVPFIHWTGSSFKNDSVLALFQLGALYACLRGRASGNQRWFHAGVFLLAASFGVKHTALFGAIPLGLLFLSAVWRRPRLLGTLVLIGLLFGFGWHARTYLLKGSPVYPAGTRAITKQFPPIQGGSRPPLWKLYTLYPWITHFNGTRCFETPSENPCGIFLVLFLPMWLFVRRRKRRLEETACWFFLVVYLAYLGYIWLILRYGIIPFMLLIIFAAARLHSFHENSGRWVRLSIHGALAYSLMFAMLMSMIIEINGPQLYYFAGKISKQEYLIRTVASYPSVDFLSRNAPAEAAVLGMMNRARGYLVNPKRFNIQIPNWHRRHRMLDVTAQRLAERRYEYLVLPAPARKGFETSLAEKYDAELLHHDKAFLVYRLHRDG